VSIVGHDEWLEARKQLLAKEKEFTRARDELTRQRQALPWEPVENDYVFDGPNGNEALTDLFDGRSQLIVYHFMFAPEDDVGCKSCSFWADNFNPNVIHLNARDVSFAAVSRAPLDKLEAYRERMGWNFHWVSSGATDFNFDYGASFKPEQQGEDVYNYGTLAPRIADREGLSIFAHEDGSIFHTYSAYARGIDLVNTAYNYLDLVPRGRDEGDQGQAWVRRHNEY
jgi:predicted dithiol-disulfide oxidoreductase (DUF899 family)